MEGAFNLSRLAPLPHEEEEARMATMQIDLSISLCVDRSVWRRLLDHFLS